MLLSSARLIASGTIVITLPASPCIFCHTVLHTIRFQLQLVPALLAATGGPRVCIARCKKPTDNHSQPEVAAVPIRRYLLVKYCCLRLLTVVRVAGGGRRFLAPEVWLPQKGD
jgi:hypothetical protein